MTSEPGDVVTVAFVGATGIKRRPAVVVSSRVYHANRPDVILGLLTTQVATAITSTDFVLQDWASAGLRKPSAFRAYLETYMPSESVGSGLARCTKLPASGPCASCHFIMLLKGMGKASMKQIDENFVHEELSWQVLTARTLPEIQATKSALQAWLQSYPDEEGMADGFEVLSHREDWVREQQVRSGGLS